jgi:hypothetical protein
MLKPAKVNKRAAAFGRAPCIWTLLHKSTMGPFCIVQPNWQTSYSFHKKFSDQSNR